jgi:hypothetical protein
VAAFALTFLLHLSAIVFAVNDILGVQSALPMLVPAVAFLCTSRRLRALAVGAALGLSMFFSTEQGLAVVIAYLCASAFAMVRRSNRRGQLAESVSAVMTSVIVLVSCLMLVGGTSGVRGALRYNFRIVPMDQYWYFGAPPNAFVDSWRSLPGMLIRAPLIGGGLVLALVAAVVYVGRFWSTPEGDPGRRNFALLLLPIYALVSCGSLLGVFTNAYIEPCWRALLLLGLLELGVWSDRLAAAPKAQQWFGVPRGMALATMGLSAVAFVGVPLLPSVYVSLVPHVIEDHLVHRKGFAIEGIWPDALREEQRVVDAHRGAGGELPTMWSTYSGEIEARNGIFHPSFDYIIHALGPQNRRAYLSRFRKVHPAIVQTVLPTETQYEPWIENTSWEFYGEVLKWYTVSSTTPWSIFWERRTTPAPDPTPIGSVVVQPGITAVRLPPIPDTLAYSPTVLDVDVEYDVQNRWQWLPVVGNSPRFLVLLEGAVRTLPISLDPYVRHVRFPVVADPRRPVTLHFQVFSLLPSASLRVSRVSAAVRVIDDANKRWLESLTR